MAELYQAHAMARLGEVGFSATSWSRDARPLFEVRQQVAEQLGRLTP